MVGRRAVVATLALVFGAWIAACSGTSHPGPRVAPPRSVDLGRASVLVLVPHPDDEAIMAAGVIARERRSGRRVAVAVVTNGDLSCERDGLRREDETIDAMARLGVPEEDVFFLGYPDGHLDELSSVPLAPLPRRTRSGGCGSGATTYAARGRGHSDVHTWLTGQPARYTSDAVVFDIASLIERLAPTDVFTSHPIDEHPDHASVYVFVRRAVERGSGRTPRLHRALVHIGGCWPTAAGLPPCPAPSFTPEKDVPPLPPPFERYRPSELIAVPDAMRLPSPASNPKYLAIASYASQTGARTRPLSYMFSFARAREPFFPESLVADGTFRLRRAPASNESSPTGWRCGGVEADDERALEIARRLGATYGLRKHGPTLDLERTAAPSAMAVVLKSWNLPPARSASTHSLEITIDVRPDDGGVGEITVRRDGEILGVAIDPEPLVARLDTPPAASSTANARCEAF